MRKPPVVGKNEQRAGNGAHGDNRRINFFLLVKQICIFPDWGNSSPRGTKPAGVICAIALKFLSKILDGEMDFW